jgi:chloramphenicol O-acetyltransferase type A
MATYIDTAAWPRRDAFEHYRGFDKPYFNVCTRLDVSHLKAAVKQAGGGGLSLAVYFIALRLANAQEPFRLRLEGGRVRLHERVRGSTTVLRDDESFGFAELEPDDDFRAFSRHAGEAIARARDPRAHFEPRVGESAVIHLTTLPWVHFTSFSHARNWGREDAVPKLAFGRADAEGARVWLPVSVEVHHALMDGLHVGRYLEAFEAALRDPQAWLVGATGPCA